MSTNHPKDVRDLYQRGGREALDQVPVYDWQPPPDEPQPEESAPDNTTQRRPFTDYLQNDLGASELFADRCGDVVRFVNGIGWLSWNGTIWERDSVGRVIQLFATVSKRCMAEAADIDDEDRRKRVVRYALQMGLRNKIEAALKLAESHPAITLKPEELDSDPLLAACQNGVIDLTNGRFHKPNPGDHITRQFGTYYDPAALCPRWERFLDEITDGDGELIEFLQRSVGYSLTGSMKEQVFLFLHGTGANGKSVFIETIRALLGGYSSRASESLFEAKGPPRDSRVELAELPGIRVLFVSETSQGGRLNERLVKDITGGDALRAEAKYQSGFRFSPQFKVWIVGNYAPRVDGVDHGIWRRVRLVPFNVTFEGDRKDPHLVETLQAELPGILRWAVDGAVKWHRSGLNLPECVKLATNAYRDDQDLLADFITEHLERAPDGMACKTAVYSRYREWCQDEGLNHPQSAKQLCRQLKQRGMTDGGRRGKYWHGVKLIDDDALAN